MVGGIWPGTLTLCPTGGFCLWRRGSATRLRLCAGRWWPACPAGMSGFGAAGAQHHLRTAATERHLRTLVCRQQSVVATTRSGAGCPAGAQRAGTVWRPRTGFELGAAGGIHGSADPSATPHTALQLGRVVAAQWRAGLRPGHAAASVAMAMGSIGRTRLGQPGACPDVVQLACLALGAVDFVALATTAGTALATIASGHPDGPLAGGPGLCHLRARTRQRLAADFAGHCCRRRVCPAHLAPQPQRTHRLAHPGVFHRLRTHDLDRLALGTNGLACQTCRQRHAPVRRLPTAV